MAVQADGKYVVAGSSACGSSSSDFAIARYKADGTLDTSFSGDGKVRDNFGGSEGWAVATLETDGQILVGGYTTGAGGNRNFAVARYNANGSLDDGTASDADPSNSFASAGVATIDFGGADGVRGLAVQPDGRIVAVGVGGSSPAMAVARLNADGTPDATFGGSGGGGKVTVATGPGSAAANGVAIQADGKVLVAGYACDASTGSNTILARLNADGSPDSGAAGDADVSDRFGPAGGGGVASVDFTGGYDRGQALALTTDGRIVLAGHTVSAAGTYYFAVARLTADGALDATFGSGGKVTAFAAGSQAYAVAADGGGRLTVAGSVPRAGGTGGERDFVVARLLEDGAFDAGFGASGTVQTNFATNRSDAAYAIALTPAGGLVAVGSSNGDFALARYAPGGSATQRLYALQDANYNVTALVNAAGQVVQRFTYDAYGVSQTLTAAWLGTSDGYDWLFRHQGGRLETATGIYHFRNRDYSPVLGRWMQQDPLGYVNGLSLYQALISNPVTHLDPTGEAVPLLVLVGIAIVATWAGDPNVAIAPTTSDPPGLHAALVREQKAQQFCFLVSIFTLPFGFGGANLATVVAGKGGLGLTGQTLSGYGGFGLSHTAASDFLSGEMSGDNYSSGTFLGRSATSAVTTGMFAGMRPIVSPVNTMTRAEIAEALAIAWGYNATIDVVGSRAAAKGHNIHTVCPPGKGKGTRSDIDFKFDQTHPEANQIMKGLGEVSNGAGSGGKPKHSTHVRPTRHPYIRLSPDGTVSYSYGDGGPTGGAGGVINGAEAPGQ